MIPGVHIRDSKMYRHSVQKRHGSQRRLFCLKYSATKNTNSYGPAFISSAPSNGWSVRPSWFVVTDFNNRGWGSASDHSSIFIPAAGCPCAVSRTCVLNFPGILI